MAIKKKLTTRNGSPVVDRQSIMTAGKRGPALRDRKYADISRV